MQQIQQYEESRINLTKYNLDKFVKHLGYMGKQVLDLSNDTSGRIQKESNDLSKFIEINVSQSKYPSEPVTFELFQISDDLLRYKKFLAEQTKELKSQADVKYKELLDKEHSKQKLLELILNIIYHK